MKDAEIIEKIMQWLEMRIELFKFDADHDQEMYFASHLPETEHIYDSIKELVKTFKDN